MAHAHAQAHPDRVVLQAEATFTNNNSAGLLRFLQGIQADHNRITFRGSGGTEIDANPDGLGLTGIAMPLIKDGTVTLTLSGGVHDLSGAVPDPQRYTSDIEYFSAAFLNGGTTRITDGAEVISSLLFIGSNASDSAGGVVDGPNSQLRMGYIALLRVSDSRIDAIAVDGGDLTVGNYGTGSLTIQNGGSIRNVNTSSIGARSVAAGR